MKITTPKPRLFISADIKAGWPNELPFSRLIAEEDRHITLAFLGNAPFPLMEKFPLPSFQIGPGGYSTKWCFLPDQHHARVVSANWKSPPQTFLDYQALVSSWLREHGYALHDKRPFWPHITVARGGFSVEEWEKIPCQIPFYLSAISLKESLGYSKYQTYWSHSLTPPFEEIEHTADIAFLVRGVNFSELALHAQLAIAFYFPPIISYLPIWKEYDSLDGVIEGLNQIIAIADCEIGVALKAVSYHTEISQKDHFLEWRMIIDV